MKIRSPWLTIWFAFLSLIILSACRVDPSAQRAANPAQVAEPPETRDGSLSSASQPVAPLPERGWPLDMPRVDEQGAVSVEITPLNLNVPSSTLDFSVVLNTHSLDLSMDLSALAALITDTGLELPASVWDAPLGGHHVQGVLKFPAVQDGVVVMDGVRRLNLVLRGLDAPERNFVWER